MRNKILGGVIALAVCVTLAYAAATTFDNVRVKGTLQVDGASSLNGRLTTTGGLVVPAVSGLLASTPTVAGMLANTTNYVLYVASATTSPSAWLKVGAQ